MYKVPHDNEESPTITKSPHRFEMYENWNHGNSVTRRFVSTVTCYANPFKDPNTKDDGGPRIFPLPHTNERYQMYIEDVRGVSFPPFCISNVV